MGVKEETMMCAVKGEKEDQIVGGCERKECCVCNEGRGQRLDCGCEENIMCAVKEEKDEIVG